MKKIINPVMCNIGKSRRVRGFCEINFESGNLYITGAINPREKGAYSYGQCVEDIEKGKPTKEWTNEMVEKFCAIWKEWHLNNMRPECEHQYDLRWRELAKETITIQKDSKETIKQRGQVHFDEDPRGILYKPCPVCGYKYGERWNKKEIPQDVIEFLMNLPETKVKPTWI